MLDRLGPEELEVIEPHLSVWLRRARRLRARDAAIQALGGHYLYLVSGRAAAKELGKELRRYAASGWRIEASRPPTGNEKRRLMHRILTLNRGKPIAADQLRSILAGFR